MMKLVMEAVMLLVVVSGMVFLSKMNTSVDESSDTSRDEEDKKENDTP